MSAVDLLLLAAVIGLIGLDLKVMRNRKKRGNGGCPYCSNGGDAKCPSCVEGDPGDHAEKSR